jgi:hypothetical protein
MSGQWTYVKVCPGLDSLISARIRVSSALMLSPRTCNVHVKKSSQALHYTKSFSNSIDMHRA